MCVVLGVLIILTLAATLTEICASQVLSSARASRRRKVCFALASDHLHDGFWSWENICGSRFQPAICVFKVFILQGSNCAFWCAMAACPHTCAWMWVLRMCCFKAPIVGLLSAICLVSRCQRSSGIVLMVMPLGAYAAHTNPASIDSKPPVTSASSSICSALTTSSLVRRCAWSQVALPNFLWKAPGNVSPSEDMEGRQSLRSWVILREVNPKLQNSPKINYRFNQNFTSHVIWHVSNQWKRAFVLIFLLCVSIFIDFELIILKSNNSLKNHPSFRL